MRTATIGPDLRLFYSLLSKLMKKAMGGVDGEIKGCQSVGTQVLFYLLSPCSWHRGKLVYQIKPYWRKTVQGTLIWQDESNFVL